MVRPSEEFEFRAEDPAPVLVHMDRLGVAHRGWVNLQPGIDERDAPPPQSALTIIFSTAIHDVPVCTWVAGRFGRKGLGPDSLGVQHATGPRVVGRLGSLGLALPEGWRWVQDHPRRGLVMVTPPGTAHDVQLRFLLEAGKALSKIPLTGDWRALVYEGR